MEDEFLGVVKLFAFNFAPEGWKNCDGSILPIQQYEALFSLLGTQFGGDGKSTFALPKLAGPIPNLHYCICCEGIYPARP